MARSDMACVLCLLVLGFVSLPIEGQTIQKGSNPYGLDSIFLQDPFYNPDANKPQGFNPYPDPSLFPPGYHVYPTPPPPAYNPNPNPAPASSYSQNPALNYYNQNPVPNYSNQNPAPNYSNQNPVPVSYNPNPAPKYYNQNPAPNYNDPSYYYNPNPNPNPNPGPNPNKAPDDFYYSSANSYPGSINANYYGDPNSGKSGYQPPQYQYGYGTLAPPTQPPPTTTPPLPSTPESAASAPSGEEQEVDDGVASGGGGGPVFNTQLYASPQQVQPAVWPFANLGRSGHSRLVNGVRLYTYPPASGGRGLLESVANPYLHYRQQPPPRQQQQPFGFGNDMANNPLLLMFALSSF